MRSLILHIGHFKTGTTALQVFLASNREALAAQGLHYAETAVHHAKHSMLAFPILHEAGARELLFGFDGAVTSAEGWDLLLDEARSLPDGGSLLVSSEEFIRFGAYPQCAQILRERLAGAGDLQVRVIAYLRAPQAHLQSYYNQLVKMDIPVAGFDATVRGRLEPIHWDYAQALAPWIEVFGSEAVLLRQFDDRLRAGDAIYRDFLGALGFDMPQDAVFPAQDPNTRLDPALLPLRRGVKRSGLKPRQARPMLAGFQEALLAERGEDAGPEFTEIRRIAGQAIENLARLPGAALDTEAMLAALPQPQPAPQRAQDEVTAMLLAEIAALRAQLAAQGQRIAALEAGQAPETGTRPAPRLANRGKDAAS